MQYSQENNHGGVFFLTKLQTFKPATLLEKDSNAGMFKWNLRNFLEYLFLRTPLGAAFVSKTDHNDVLKKDTLLIFLLRHDETKKQR